MAELDKKSESAPERRHSTEPAADGDDVTDAPRRNKKPEKARSRDRNHKKNPAKLAAGPSSADGGRLRSSRWGPQLVLRATARAEGHS